MMQDIQMPDKPPGKVCVRSLFQEGQGMREKPCVNHQSQWCKMPIRVKETAETVPMQSIHSDGLGGLTPA